MSSTAKEVARLAGVSTATVSRVTNGSGRVSVNTRMKVLNAIKELRYRPNAYAIELGRAKGGVPRKRRDDAPANAQRTDASAAAAKNGQHRTRFDLVEKEYWRLRGLAANLAIDLQRLTSIAQQLQQTLNAAYINAAAGKSSQAVIEVREQESHGPRGRTANFGASSAG